MKNYLGMAWAGIVVGPTLCLGQLTTYDSIFSLNTRLSGLSNKGGISLAAVPNDLAITALTVDITGSNFVGMSYGPNTPASISTSTFGASGDVVIAGIPHGDSAQAISIGDGLTLSSFVHGSIGDFSASPVGVVSSDVSQYGEIRFVNSSATETYTANLSSIWTFDVEAVSQAPFWEFQTGYIMEIGERTSTSGQDLFLEDGFRPTDFGQSQNRSGILSQSFDFEILPNSEHIFVVRPYVGGWAVSVPEPSTNGHFAAAALVAAIGLTIWRRRNFEAQASFRH